MDGHRYYPNNHNAHLHSQSTSNNVVSGCADNTTAPHMQPNHQPMPARRAALYTDGFNGNIPQHPSSSNSFHGYAGGSMGHYAQSRQSRPRTEGKQMYQRSASNNSGVGHVENNSSLYAQCNYQPYQLLGEGSCGYAQSDQQTRAAYNSSHISQHHQHQPAPNNASYRDIVPRSVVAASHASSLGQTSRPLQSPMNHTHQGHGQSGHIPFQGQHRSNVSSAQVYYNNKNTNSATSPMLHNPIWQPASVGMHPSINMSQNGSKAGGNQLQEDSSRYNDTSIIINSNRGLTNSNTNMSGTNNGMFCNVNARYQTNVSGNSSNSGLYPSLFVGQSTTNCQTSSNSQDPAKSKALPQCQSLSISAFNPTTPIGYSPLSSSSKANKGGVQYNVMHTDVPFTGISKEESASMSVVTIQPTNRHGVVVNQTQDIGLASVVTNGNRYPPSTTTANTKNNAHNTMKRTRALKSQTTAPTKSLTPTNSSTVAKLAKLPVSNPGMTSKPLKCQTASKAVVGAVIAPKRIEIPSEFSPSHSFRAAAAYSLLRTLSKELRLSPFTLQSFLSALMLPVPSRLLGEVHVRVMRVLFAHAGLGTYAKQGLGDTHIFLKKNKRVNYGSVRELDSEGESVEVEELITKRGCDNLFFLDSLTWPLFYEDYAVATESKFMEDLDDEDAFIDSRSAAMISSDLADQQHFGSSEVEKLNQRATVPPYPGEGWIDRCPIGPLGRRNHMGRFTCCPFHIQRSAENKKKKRSQNDSSSDYDSSDGSGSESDNDFEVKRKPLKGTGRRGRPRKHPKREPRTVTSPIKGSLVTDIEIAPATARTHPNTDAMQKADTCPLHKCSGSSYPVTAPAKLPPVFVPPIPPYPADLNALAVSVSSRETLARYFKEGDLFCSDSDKNDKADGGICPQKQTTCPMSKNLHEELAHMSPIRQLRSGIPYHHLSLKSKITIIEFLLDELLTVDEISKELMLRHTLAGQSNILYGLLPHPSEFENMANEDECTICGLEGDLLCCDGCPGSFHRQCLCMYSGKLPEGKWFCTECRAADASKMGPLRAECRPLIGWFTLDELEVLSPHPLNSHGTCNLAVPSARLDNVLPQHLHGHPTTNVYAAVLQDQFAAPPTDTSKVSAKIPTDVEFLVTSGKVFARHRSSFLKFDPFKPLATGATSFDLTKSSHPPEPLSNIQVVELLNLLGPAMSLRLPWRQLLFDPEKVFNPSKFAISSASTANISNELQELVSHQKEARLLLENHSDMANPLDYDNKYRKAPPILKLKHQLKHFIFPTVIPEFVTFPARTGAQLGLALSATAALDSKSPPSPGFPFHDVVRSLRGVLIKTERLLYDGCLLDYQWESLRWRAKVNNACTFLRLSALLVRLSDACCPRAFQSQWNEVKKNGNQDEIARTASVDQKGSLSSIFEGWSADRELRTRRWERITKDLVLRRFKAEEELRVIFNDADATKKRKKTKISSRSLSDKTVASIDGENLLVINGSIHETCADSSKQKQLASHMTASPPFQTNSCVSGEKNHEHDLYTATPETGPSLQTFERKSAGTRDPKMNEGMPNESPTVKLKSKKRRRTREPSLSPFAKKRCLSRNNAVRLRIASLLSLNTFEYLEKEIKELKLDILEELLGQETSSFFFSIAGRQLFDPEGTLSSQNIKRLARNAGSARAPFIAYDTSFEVGECTTCHQWRKSALKGATFEDFVLSLRVFDSHIDKGITASSCSITDRIAKSKMTPSTAVIRCEQIDPVSGLREYFVVDTKRNQGRWQSETEIDLMTLISHRYSKGAPLRERLKERQNTEEEKRKHHDDEQKKIAAEKRQQELLQRLAQNTKSKATSSVSRSANPANVSTISSFTITDSLNEHIDLTLRLLRRSAARGEASVPVSAMVTARELTMKRMTSANLVAKATNKKALTVDDMKRKMTTAESAAVQRYVKEINSSNK